jgi:pyruvate kinase
LNWGVIGMVVEKTESTDETIERIKQQLVKTKVFAAGSIVIFTIGRPLVGRAKTNMLSIETL